MRQSKGQWAVTIACVLITMVALSLGHTFWEQVLLALAGLAVLVAVVAVLDRLRNGRWLSERRR